MFLPRSAFPPARSREGVSAGREREEDSAPIAQRLMRMRIGQERTEGEAGEEQKRGHGVTSKAGK